MALQTKEPSTAVISSVGTAQSGGTTTSTKPVITGTADAGNIVVIYDGIRMIGSVVAAADGSWSLTPTADLSAGAHRFMAIAHDTDGNYAPSSALVNVTIASTVLPAPATPTLTDDASLPIVAGSTTADAHPHINGTGTAGNIITVYDGSTPLGSVKVGGDGKWTFTPTSDLTNGTHAINATEKAPGGTESAHSGNVGFTVDTSIPEEPIIVSGKDYNAQGGLIDTISSGAIIPASSVTITGTTLSTSVVYIYDGSKLIGSTQANQRGDWSYSNTAYSNGVHDLTATVKNAAGTESAHSDPFSFTVNTSAPATPAAPSLTDDSGAAIPAGSTTADAHPHINGNGTAGDTITVYDGGKAIGSTTVKPDGTWSFTPVPDLGPGPHDITVTDTNAAGTPSLPSNPTHITIDTSVPGAPATPTLTDDNGAVIPGGSTTNDAHPHISGTGTAGDIIKIYDGATVIGSAKVDGNGKWTFTPTTDLSNATHSISVTEVNAASTESPHSTAIGFTVDTTLPNAPTITLMNDYRFDNGALITAVPSGSTITSANVSFGGQATANGVVYVYDGNTMIASVKADATGYWFYASKAYANGLHDMSATQKSPAGVETAHSNHWTFTLNAVTPATPGVPVITNDAGTAIPSGGTTNDAHPHIAGTGTAGDVITVLDNGNVIGSTTVAGNGTWSFTPSTDLANGANAITVQETNPAGNASAVSPPAAFTIDTSVPAKPPVPVLTDDSGASIPAGSTTNDGHPHISGTGKAGDIITVYDGATALGSVKIGGDGKWTFTPSTDVSTGAHSISVTDTNAAGTTGPKSDAIAFTYSVVAGAPVITSIVDAVGTITGPIVNGGVTDDNQPTISGTGVPGNTIWIYQNGAGCGDGVVDSTGHWSVKLKGALSEGLHVMTATQFVPGNAESPASNSWNITVDTSVPKTPVAPTLTDDSGAAIAAGSTTADAHPHINGNGTAGDTITVYDGGKAIGSTTVKPDGTWSFTPSPDLNSGAHDITVTDTNAAGTPSLPSNPTHITIDTSVPAAPPVPVLTDDNGAVIPAGSTTADGHPHISGTGTAGDIITVYDGATALGSVKIGGDGKWTFTPTTDLSNATHSITVTDTNAAGTTGPHSGAVSFTVDSVAPAAPVIVQVYDYTTTGNILIGQVVSGSVIPTPVVRIGGTAAANAVVYIYDGAALVGSEVANAGGVWIYLRADYSSGAHDISVTQKSAAGVESAHSSHWTFTVDTSVPKTPAAPTLTDDSGAAIAAGSTTADAHPHINGNGTAGDTITVYDGGKAIGSTTVKPDGTWSFTPSPDLNSGAHDITVTDTNAAGTPSLPSNPTHITIDTSVPTAPPVPVLTDDGGAMIPAGSTTADGHPHISGTGTAGDIITVYDGATALGSVKIGSDGKWTFTPSSDLSNATHTITVTDTNAAGTTSPHSDAISFTVGQAPTGTASFSGVYDHASGSLVPPGGSTRDTSPVVQGVVDQPLLSGESVAVYRDGVKVGLATMVNGSLWSFNDSGVGVGSHTYTIRLENSAGAGPFSGGYVINEMGALVAPTETVTITGLYDHSTSSVVPTGGSTKDTTPTVQGSVSSALLAGETVVIYRDGSKVGTATVSGTGWSFNDSGVGVGSHYYEARVENSVGNGPTSNHFTFSEVPPIVAPTEGVVISGLYDDRSGNLVSIALNATTSDSKPVLKGAVTQALASGESLAIYRDTVKIGTATVNGTSWSFSDPGLSEGNHIYNARVENSAGRGPISAGFSFAYKLSTIEYDNIYFAGTNTLAPRNYESSGPFSIRGYSTLPDGTKIRLVIQGDALSNATFLYKTVTVSGGKWILNFGANTLDDSGHPLFPNNSSSGLGHADFWIELTPGNKTLIDNLGWVNLGSNYLATRDLTLATDDSTHANSSISAATDAATATVVKTVDPATTHTSDAPATVVNDHEAFKGTTGHEVVDLNVDPTAYFKEATAHIEGNTAHTVDPTTGTATAVNTLHLTGDHQVLDLTSLTGKTAAAKISGIEAIDLGGQHNTLKLSLVDVLNLGEADLFMKDGKQQMMVQGKEGDEVDLSNAHIAGVADGQWEAHGTAEVGGVTYNVYEHFGAHTELLVQQGVQIVVH